MKQTLITFLCLFYGSLLFAQQSITGTVTDGDGNQLPGVNIQEKGTSNGSVTDFDGKYTIETQPNATLVFSYVGFEPQTVLVKDQTEINVKMAIGSSLAEVVLVGSRSPKRTATDTPVAIDVIDIENIPTQIGKVEINELLKYTAPSFNVNKQSGSDGADHIDPASLRGLGPDQTLVLINGKRRHTSSLINVFGTRGRGNTGTDLNAIPATAIKRIEILRDGAAAQYGSDAIAGVINIVLKDNTDKFSGSISYGTYNTNAKGDFPDGTPNTGDNRLDTDLDGNALADEQALDGGSVKVGANYGVSIGEGGFANFTTEFVSKNKTLRPGYDFRRGYGEAALDGFNFMANASVPLSDNTDFYAFGGRNFRDTDAYAFTRNPESARIVEEIYPNGFTPRITSDIVDNSVSAGIRTKTDSGWNIDINNTYGKNDFHYFIEGTLNASLGEQSPNNFDAGGHSLSQNTTGIDVSKFYENFLSGTNIAMGFEYRTEQFEIFAGEPGSYGTFDTNGLLITDAANQVVPTDPVTGDPRPGGSQGFPGYSPANEVSRSRTNLSFYVDGEFDLSESVLVAAAARFENYSDFGETLNGKLATRIKITEDFNFRGSVSTGFRAPSLAQIYYNLRFTDFVGGEASETLLAANNNPITQSVFGIDQLEEEKALNASLGFTLSTGGFTATLDGYYIDIKDRIVLTEKFSDDTNAIPNVADVQFFSNAIDTRTTGLDLILSYKGNLGKSRLGATFTGNINKMEIRNVNNGTLPVETFFGAREKSFLLASAPESKFILNLNYAVNWFDMSIACTRFSEIELIDFAGTTDFYSAQFITDLSFGFKMSESMKLSIGSNNLFNEYPDQQNDGETDSGGYWDAVQQGASGAYYYARLDYKF